MLVRSSLVPLAAVCLLPTVAACDLAPPPAAAEGQLSVRVAAFRDLGLRVELEIAIWEGGDAPGDPMTKTFGVADFVTPDEIDADWKGTFACHGGKAGMVEVNVRVRDASSEELLEDFAQSKLFTCTAGKVVELPFVFQSQVDRDTGAPRVSVRFEDVEFTCGTGMHEAQFTGDQDSLITTIALGGILGGTEPKLLYGASARDVLGKPLTLADLDITAGTTLGDHPLSYFDVEVPRLQKGVDGQHTPIVFYEARIVFPALDGLATGTIGPRYRFEWLADGTVKHGCSVVEDVARLAGGWAGAGSIAIVTNVGVGEPVTNIDHVGGGFGEGGIRVEEMVATASADALSASVAIDYRADSALYPKGVVGTGAIDFGADAFGVLVEGVVAAVGEKNVAVAWCGPVGAEGARTIACETSPTTGNLVLHSLEDSLARAGATQGQ